MDHERYKNLLQLAVADEITADEMSTLRDHLTECDKCRTEFNDLRQLMTVLGEGGVAEPSEQMLWETRRRLFETIRQESPAQSALPRTTQDVAPMVSGPTAGRGSTLSPSGLTDGWMNWLRGYRLAFSGATAIAIGVFVGYLSFGRSEAQQAAATPVPAANYEALGNPDIANVRFVNTEAPDGEMEIHYDLVRPVRLRAGVNDERMQRMLAYALLNEENAGVRLQAVNAFAATTPRARGDNDVKTALIEALTTDPNPGVRRESLRVLQTLPFDIDIKNACLFVLTNDDNPGMRVASIGLLARATQAGDLAGGDIYNELRSQLGDDDLLRANTAAFIQEDNDAE